MTEEEYNKGLARVETLMDIAEDEMSEAEGKELDRLATIVEEYEKVHFPLLPPEDPQGPQ